MKKIMIALAVAAMAVASQAATIKWTSNSMALTDAEGTAISALPAGTTLALVVMDSATGWDTAVDTGSSVAINTRVGASLGRVTGTLNFAYTAGGDIDNGKYLALMFKDADGLHQLTYTSGANAGELVDAVWKIDGLSSNSSSLTGKAIAMTGNFTAEAIPEPTSGLLMLLGMAGLALRRRRA